MEYLRYRLPSNPPVGGPPLAHDYNTQVIRGTACLQALLALKEKGFTPDVIVAHPGWGEALFCKDVWPSARLIMFAEFFYGADGSDFAFDPEFSLDTPQARARLRMKNSVHLQALHAADAGYPGRPPKFPHPWPPQTPPPELIGRGS